MRRARRPSPAPRPGPPAPAPPSALGAVATTLRALHVGEDAGRLLRFVRRKLRRSGGQVSVPQGPPDAPSALLDSLLHDDDRRLDVGRAAVLLAWEDAAEAIDPDRALELVDRYALDLRRRLRTAGGGPVERLAAMNRWFFDELGFAAASPSPTRGGDDRLADLLLPYVLERRRGHCVGLSTAYLALGYRAGLPLFGVSAPGHFFVRWEGEGLRRNVETTARGEAYPDGHYVERFGIGPELVDRGVYLQNLRRREVLVELLNNRANFYWDRGDAARAARDLDRIVQVSHNFPRAFLGRGFMALQHGDLDRARTDLERALEIEPDLVRARVLLGAVHLRAGRLQAAEACFTDAARGGTHALACTNLGRLYTHQGRHADALAWHERALAIDPTSPAAWTELGVAREATGDPDGAGEAFRRARDLDPSFLPAREQLVLLERSTRGRLGLSGRLAARAIQRTYEQRARRAPGDDEVRVAYARFLLEVVARPEPAVDLAREAVRLRCSARNYELLAEALVAADRRGQAVNALARALDAGELRRAEAARVERLRQRILAGEAVERAPPSAA